MWARWSRALARRGFDSVVPADEFDEATGGLNVRNASLADYITKLAYEVTGSHAKEGRAGGRAPFELLADAVEGEADAIERWWEYERGSRDRRQLTWSCRSRNLRALAGLGRERTDDKIAKEELGGDDVLTLDADA